MEKISDILFDFLDSETQKSNNMEYLNSETLQVKNIKEFLPHGFDFFKDIGSDDELYEHYTCIHCEVKFSLIK